MRVHAVAPASEHELETEEGEPAELLRWQLLSVGEEEASRALLVAEGYGVVGNTAVLGTPPLTDGASIAVLNRDGQPFARPAGAAAADSGTEAPRLADVLEHAPRQLEAALTELSAQSTDMAAGLREMSDAVNAGIACGAAGGRVAMCCSLPGAA